MIGQIAMSRTRFVLLLWAGLGCGMLSHSAYADPMFTGLGDLPGGANSSRASAISGDGTTVVGESQIFNMTESFSWTFAGGMIQVPTAPFTSFVDSSRAFAVSETGTTVVGVVSSMDGGPSTDTVYSWTSSGGMDLLPGLPGGVPQSSSSGVSADGSMIVGGSLDASFLFQAVLWTSGGVPVGLGFLPGGSNSSATDITPDGSTIVGSSNGQSGRESFIWTSGNGMVGIGELPGGSIESFANAVSSDGTTVVGRSQSTSGTEAFRWSSGTGMTGLGDLPDGLFDSRATGVSSDGSIVVGVGHSALGSSAFIWDATNGMRELQTVLSDIGLSVSGWQLDEATDISPDGSRIVGWGTNPSGDTEAWIADISAVEEPVAAPALGPYGIAIMTAMMVLLAARRIRARALSA